MRCETCGRENDRSGVESFLPAVLSILKIIIKHQLDQNIAIGKLMNKLFIIDKKLSIIEKRGSNGKAK